MVARNEICVERLTPVLPSDGRQKCKIEKQLFETTKELPGIKSKVRSATQTNTCIYIGQDSDAGGGAVTGVNEVVKLPPELLQKMREVLAIGVAKSIIAKSLAELQSKEIEDVATRS